MLVRAAEKVPLGSHPQNPEFQFRLRKRVGNPIFISYRRDDSEGEAGRLFDDLTRVFGADGVFMDVSGIRPGLDFVKAIEENVANCGVLLAVIGPTWVSIANGAGQRRLEDPSDFVVLEIASALKRTVPVIPILVHGARMPSPDQLPESLKSFSYRNSVELSHTRWNSDVKLLIEALTGYVAPSNATAQEPVHAAVSVQLPAPSPSAEQRKTAVKRSRLPLILGASLVMLAIAVGLYFAFHKSTPPLVGKWKDADPRTGNSLIRLVITGSGGSLSMHAYGSCQPTPCDWGAQTAGFNGATATATYTLTNQPGSPNQIRVAAVTVRPAGSNLNVTVQNTLKGQGAAREVEINRIFVPGS
jgi:hypothetical protein